MQTRPLNIFIRRFALITHMHTCMIIIAASEKIQTTVSPFPIIMVAASVCCFTYAWQKPCDSAVSPSTQALAYPDTAAHRLTWALIYVSEQTMAEHVTDKHALISQPPRASCSTATQMGLPLVVMTTLMGHLLLPGIFRPDGYAPDLLLSLILLQL